MSDPLSIAASVAGLLSLSGSLCAVISGFVSRIADAPDSARDALVVVEEMRMALTSIKQVMDRLSGMPRDRKEMIHVRHLVVTFRESIQSLSELEALIGPADRLWDRIKWTLEEEKIVRAVQRLASHKASLLTMITILQCDSIIEARERSAALEETVQQILAQNHALLRRLERLDFIPGVEDASIRFYDDDDDRSSVRGPPPIRGSARGKDVPVLPTLQESIPLEASFNSAVYPREFEAALEQSRVYLRVRSNECDVSFTSSVPRTNAWSMLSGLSLSDLSVVSVIALPISLEEINSIGPGLTFAKILSGNRNQARTSEPAPPGPGPAARKPSGREAVLQKRPGTSNVAGEMALHILVLIGDRDTGKAELANQFFLGFPFSSYDPTMEDPYRKRAIIDGQACMIEALDTSGVEQFTGIQDLWLRAGEGFIIAYSISNRASFYNVRGYYREIQKEKKLQHGIQDSHDPFSPASDLASESIVPVVIVGNESEEVAERRVSTEEGAALARELGCPFVETSVRNGIDAEKVFIEVVRELRRRPPPTPSSTSTSPSPPWRSGPLRPGWWSSGQRRTKKPTGPPSN